MPKKFTGENTKAKKAKDNKQKVKEGVILKRNQEADEEKWREKSKSLEKKLKKKEEEEKKRHEHLKKKAELKDFLKKETESITKAKTNNLGKLTRTQINLNVGSKKPATKSETGTKRENTHITTSLTESFNKMSLNAETARTINEAIAILTEERKVEDRHPEKRLKAAYQAFEEERLKQLKPAHPTLKLSQLKQMVLKEWQKI